MAKAKFNMDTIYAEISAYLIEMLEAGTAPWSKPWIVRASNDPMMPRNGISNRAYTGFNSLYLGMLMEENGWNDPRFYTMKSLGEGQQVKKGSKSTMIVFNKATQYDKENSEGEVETKTSWIARYYRVFNASQIDGIEEWVKPEVEVESFDYEDNGYPEADFISAEWCENLDGGLVGASNKAYYTPATDTITMPDVDQFPVLAEYYQTLFHEIVHSTGHDTRGDRLIRNNYGTGAYAKEELVAEFGAAFLCANTQVPLNSGQSAAYLKGWAERCKEDPKLLFTAANAASYAANMVMENTYAVA